MNFKEIKRTDIKDKKEFNRIGYHYTRIWEDNTSRIYVYRMHHIEKELPYYQYEVVKGVKKNGVYAYPSDEEFGLYGWYICGTAENCSLKISQKLSELLKHSVKFECESIG